MSQSHGLKFEGSRFWVMHRRRDYGPFDYEWSKDFCGVELMYRGQKFGEYCSAEEIFADLKQFRLPMRVVEVASIAMGCTLFGLLEGLNEPQREQHLLSQLHELGYEKFARIDRLGDPV